MLESILLDFYFEMLEAGSAKRKAEILIKAVQQIERAPTSPVEEFHEAFGHPVRSTPTEPPTNERVLRVKLMFEEAFEFALASGVSVRLFGQSLHVKELQFDNAPYAPDIVEVADALADIRYVTDGANLSWGLPQEEVLAEVHRSNMSKLGSEGRPVYREDGKILKGPNYSPPDIYGVLRKHGWEE